MSKNVAMFVDVANLYYAARGQDVDVDYVALLKHATKGRDLIRAYAYSGLDPENENQRKFIDFLSKNGYKALTKDIRKFGDGRVKANLDIELVVDLFRLADRMDIAVIVSGDGDFAPAIKALQDKGVRCEVISFRPNTSSDLIAVADEFVDIMKIASIGRGKEARAAAAGMSAPEMPAKEVVPEFGFREASPAVAAAALAAIKGGPSARGNGRRGGRGRGGAPAEEPTPSETAAVATDGARAETEEGRRRRRRRGGRGRGRGRRELETGAAPAAEGEIGWEELDDLSQVDDLGEEREYTFAEADEETLRELGLATDTGADAAAGAEPEPEPMAVEAEAPAVRTRARGRRRAAEADAAEANAVVAEAAVADEQPAPTPARRRRSTAAKVNGESRATRRRTARTKKAAEAAADAEPARRTRGSRTRKAADEAPAVESASESTEAASATEPEDAEQPQGIWGRFRAGRGS